MSIPAHRVSQFFSFLTGRKANKRREQDKKDRALFGQMELGNQKLETLYNQYETEFPIRADPRVKEAMAQNRRLMEQAKPIIFPELQ